MVQKEISEIKKILTASDCCIHRLAGCYVDANKELHIISHGRFLVLPEEEQHKYLDLIRKGLSGRQGKNLINLEFNKDGAITVGNRDRLLRLLDSELDDEELLQEYFTCIRDNYAYVDNYYIMVVYGLYDVPKQTMDGLELEDASEDVYKFNLTLMCPMKPSKAGLVYNPIDNSLENAMRNMMVEPPVHGYLFPAFTDRASDIHSVLYYTKKPSELSDGLLNAVLGCVVPATAGEQNDMFINAVVESSDMTFDKAKSLYSNIREHEIELKDGPDENIVDKNDTARILEESGFAQEEIEVFKESFARQTEEGGRILLSNVFEGSNKLRIKAGKTDISLPLELTDYVEVRKIDGKNCIVIEINDELMVNGVHINRFETSNEA